MMNIEKILMRERLTRALTGLTPREFTRLLPTFAQTWQQVKMDAYLGNSGRRRRPGGGSKGFLKTMEHKLFFILFYYKCYPTYDLVSFLYDCIRASACRRQEALTPILEASLGKKLVLPKRQMRSVEEFFKAFPEAREVFIDGTERPIQRPKNSKKQADNYSGKKKRHTRKNLLITDRKKRVGFLGKTVPGKKHDFNLLRSQAPPDYMPKEVKKHLDRGFQGFNQQFLGHKVSMPQKKPRIKELCKAIKERNKRKSSKRVIIEHALAGVKRFRILTDVFRNKLKDFDDRVMFISCGLWNYHLSMK